MHAMQSRRWLVLAVAWGLALAAAGAHGFTVDVKDADGNPVPGFWYTVEEDTCYPVTPGVPDAASLGVNIHRAHSPVLIKGDSGPTASSANVNLPNTSRYVVSALPYGGGYTLGGAQVAVGQNAVTVVVNRLPLPTAQISIRVFHDNQPLNNAPDLPAEAGLADFQVTIKDAFGQQMLDAFGNPLGTTYLKNPDGSFLLDTDGAPVMDLMGDGIVKTDADGMAYIRNLPPGKYGVNVVPPPGDTGWVQTATIEGTPTVDAWVKAGEEAYWTEWGFVDTHVWFGFIKATPLTPSPQGTATVKGQVVYVHPNKPPAAPGLNPGPPVPDAWVAINNLNGNDEVIYAGPCDNEARFEIPNLAPGTYQLAMWDLNLDVIIDFRTFTVADGETLDLGKCPVYGWFGHLEGTAFIDLDENGLREGVELDPLYDLPMQAVNLRHPDGSLYQATMTDMAGEYGFNEIFPFFYWLVVEVDFARFKATGAKIIVDDGGPLPTPDAKLTPQPQPENGNEGWRVETGPVLTHAIFSWSDLTHEIHWGKRAYQPGENGGISGIVHYATTRAENDPRFAGAEDWEPGIPRVQVNLYEDNLANATGGPGPDGLIDDLNGDGQVTPADVDNYPFGWRDGTGAKGPEDVDHNGNGAFDPGDAIQIVTTDSWDDNLPDAVGPDQYVHGQLIRRGAETLRTWGQIRPGLFDGGYAFTSHFPGGMASGSTETPGVPSGKYYVVEAPAPRGADGQPIYEHQKEEDKNVDFGETYVPSEGLSVTQWPLPGTPPAVPAGFPQPPAPIMPAPPLALLPTTYEPAICVGDLHQVPPQLSLFPGIAAPYAGEWRRLPDRKLLFLREGRNAGTNFFLFTHAPRAGRVWGVVFNDALLEFRPDSPNKGTNLAPSWIPVSFRTFRGQEVARCYTDEWGRFNCLMPSTFTMNIGAPSGVSPCILVAVINDPGPIPDPNNPGQMIQDPWYDPGYNQLKWTFENFPGKTTRLDTPLLPIAAFRGNTTPLDCHYPDGTPLIKEVSGPDGSGPALPRNGPEAGRTLTIKAVGPMTVPNPDYDPNVPGSQPTIVRDYGFGGTPGTVTVSGRALNNVNWAADGLTITGVVPGNTNTGQLLVTRGDNGVESPIGLTVHMGVNPNLLRRVGPGQSIQAAVDSAPANAVVLIAPGTYKENVILWRPVKLQGWGAFSTIIQAGPLTPTEETAWLNRVQSLEANGAITLIPGERADFYLETAPGVLVVGRANTYRNDRFASVDGLTIQGALRGGGIFANAYADYLRISNNVLQGNQGSFGGGIRIGTPSLVQNAAAGTYYSSRNNNIRIFRNAIAQNGAIDGGGGIAIFNGADNYSITRNKICGNYSFLYGGGIAHFGHSEGGRITFNQIVNNEAFDEGGGVMVAGELVPAGANPGTLTQGSGSVVINSNLIQGNKAGDDGGGIRILMANGQDVASSNRQPNRWHRILITNNMIVNNSSADAGGGISMDDAARISILSNTIAHNDATSTGVDAFGGPAAWDVPPQLLPGEPGEAGLGGLKNSTAQVAGIASRAHSAGLRAAFHPTVAQEFSNPVLEDNIIWQNRSFYWDAAYGPFGGLRPDVQGLFGPAEAPVYWDLSVYGTVEHRTLDPRSCVLTSLLVVPDGSAGSYDASNTANDPNLIAPYVNVYQATSSGAAFGNFVSTTFTPTGLRGNYHIGPGSSAINTGIGNYLTLFRLLRVDYDGDPRPFVPLTRVDIGADERE